MAKYLLFISLFFCVFANAQQPQGRLLKPNNSRGNIVNGLLVENELYAPIKDTTWKPDRAGALTIRPQDTTARNGNVYTWTGVKWRLQQSDVLPTYFTPLQFATRGVGDTVFIKINTSTDTTEKILTFSPSTGVINQQSASNISPTKAPLKANSYFDNLGPAKSTVANISGTTIIGLEDDNTNQLNNYIPVTGYTNANVDSVVIFKKGSTFYKKVTIKSAKDFGILDNGLDQTAALQRAVNYSFGSTIFFDEGVTSSIIINGTVTVPAGVVLKFSKGNKLTGTGTINGGVIDAGFSYQIFDTTLTVNPAGVSNKSFSVQWFGAIPNDGIDDFNAIQAAINATIRNSTKFKVTYMPSGNYNIAQPLIMANWNGTSYAGFSIDLIGEGSFWQGSGGTVITASHKNTFALGIQLGKGCRVMNIGFQGAFTPPNLTGYAFYKQTFEQFTDSTCREVQASPYSGLVIDPFTNSASQIPTGGFYPGLSAYYRGTASNGGSTGIEVKDCKFFNFVVGVAFSPNGFTQNCELIKLNLTQYGNLKIAIAASQAQEKSNEITDAACWSNTHTFFKLWGLGTMGSYHIKRINIAGALVRFIDVASGGYFPVNISEVFSESMGYFGNLTSSVGGKVTDCELGFAWFGESYSIPASHINSSGILFQNCNIRMYGSYSPVILKGSSTYDNCIFEVPPYYGFSTSLPVPTFVNCSGLGNTTDVNFSDLTFLNFIQGRYRIMNNTNFAAGINYGWNVNQKYPNFSQSIGIKTIAITGTDRSFSFTVPATDILKYEVNELLYTTTVADGYALISNINTSTNTVTARLASSSIIDGAHDLYVVHSLKFFGGFIGNTTVGSNIITNLKVDIGSAHKTLTQLVGQWVETKSLFNSSTYLDYVKVLSYDGTANTYTVSSNSYLTSTGSYFSNGDTKILQIKNVNSAVNPGLILNKGSIIEKFNFTSASAATVDRFIVSKTGFYNAAGVGGGETRQAEWYLEAPPVSDTALMSTKLNAQKVVDIETGRATSAETLKVGLAGTETITGAKTFTSRLNTLLTTEQFRNQYDASNYMSATTASNGTTTMALTGTASTYNFLAPNAIVARFQNSLLSNAYVNISSSATGAFTFLNNGGYGLSVGATSDINTPGSILNIRSQSTNAFLLYIGGQDISPTIARIFTTINPVVSGSTAFTPTTGAAVYYKWTNVGNSSFQPTSGTASFTYDLLSPTYNTTGTYAGTLIGRDYDPVLTSLTGAKHISYRTVTGDEYWNTTSGSMGIGVNATIAPSAILDITSTTKGILFPRMTTTQMNAIVSPATGLLIYNLTSNSIWRYNGTSWIDNSGSAITGTNTNDAAAAGNIGERVISILSTYTNYTTTGAYQNITSITLTPGDWDLSAFYTYSANSSTITTSANAMFVISTTTASAAGSTEAKDVAYIPQAALLGTSRQSGSITDLQISIAATTTYYLNTQSTFTIGNPQFVGKIRAVRVR